MPVIPSSLAYTLMLVVRVTRAEKLLLCDDMLMHGLYHLEILPGGRTEPARAKPSKNVKKAEASTDDAVDLDAAQAVVRQLNVNDLQALQRALEHVNICGKLLEVCLLQFVGSEILCRVFGREPSPFIFMTAFMCAVYTLHRLLMFARLPMTLDGRTHPNQGTILLLLFPVYGVLLVLLAAFIPAGWVDINTDQVGRGIMHGYAIARGAWNGFVGLLQNASEPASVDPVATEMSQTGSWQDDTPVPPFLHWGALGITSALSGMVVPAMVISGQRLAVSLASILHPSPSLSAGGSMRAINMPIHCGPLKAAAAVLSAALPVFALLLWATPISEGLLGFNEQQRAMAQGCTVLCSGLLQLCTVRMFLQSHLNTALERWYLAKHQKSKTKTKHGTLVATSLISNTCALLPRVAMMLMGPAALWVTLGCIICDSAALDRDVHEVSEAGEVTLYSVAPFIVPPAMATQSIARCLAFSSLLAHAASSLAVLILKRTRVFRSTNV